MTFFSVFAIALALSMDAFAVAVSAAAARSSITLGHYFRLSFSFGFFQFLMPVIGWMLGFSVHRYIEAWDHWIAFVLLVLVGLNMLRDAWNGEEKSEMRGDPSKGLQLFMLSIATSIDAMAVGLSFSMIGLSVWGPAAVIGIVCSAVTAAGVKAGRLLGSSNIFGGKISILGAAVLIGIGVKILFEHGVF